MQGRGLINDPYLILTAADLEDIALEPEAHYRLESDIDLSGLWTPLPPFYGTLNGNGKLISGLETNTSTTRAGLFESINNAARVTHLTLVTTASGITAHVDDYKAVLCGQVICSVTGQYPFLDRVIVFGHVNTSGNRAGGLFGGIHGGDGSNADAKVFLNECAVFCTISGGGSLVGGVCGFVEDTSILGAKSCFTSTEKSGEGIIRGSSAFTGFYDLAAASISDSAVYTGWDFTNTWEMNEDGYPRLRNFPPDTATQSAKVSGIVQVDASPAQRQIRAYGYYPVVHDIDESSVTLSKSLGHAVSDAETGEYTIDLLGGYGNEIFVVAFDDYGDDFAPEMAVNVGDRVHPTTPNGYVFECTGSGTLPSEEPEWIIDTETSQLYGTASMIARVFYRPMVHGPVAPEVTATTGDPYFDSVTLLLHMDGTVGSTDFVDSSSTPKAMTAQGNAQIGSDGKFDQALSLGGGGDALVVTEGTLYGAADFTIEAQIHPTSDAATNEIVSSSDGTAFDLVFEVPTDLRLRAQIRNGANASEINVELNSASDVIALDTWQHVALTAEGSTAKLWVNGLEVASGSITGTRGESLAGVQIGRLNNGRYFIGKIDELRITKGVARYTSDFTPPAQPYPDSGPA